MTVQEPATPSTSESTSGHPPRSTPELIRDLAARATALAQKQVELARVEAREDALRELRALKRLAAAGLLALLALNMVAVAVAMALSLAMAAWLAACLVALALLIAGGALGAFAWSRRVRAPLSATRRTLAEELTWIPKRTR